MGVDIKNFDLIPPTQTESRGGDIPPRRPTAVGTFGQGDLTPEDLSFLDRLARSNQSDSVLAEALVAPLYSNRESDFAKVSINLYPKDLPFKKFIFSKTLFKSF